MATQIEGPMPNDLILCGDLVTNDGSVFKVVGFSSDLLNGEVVHLQEIFNIAHVAGDTCRVQADVLLNQERGWRRTSKKELGHVAQRLLGCIRESGDHSPVVLPAAE